MRTASPERRRKPIQGGGNERGLSFLMPIASHRRDGHHLDLYFAGVLYITLAWS